MSLHNVSNSLLQNAFAFGLVLGACLWTILVISLCPFSESVTLSSMKRNSVFIFSQSALSYRSGGSWDFLHAMPIFILRVLCWADAMPMVLALQDVFISDMARSMVVPPCTFRFVGIVIMCWFLTTNSLACSHPFSFSPSVLDPANHFRCLAFRSPMTIFLLPLCHVFSISQLCLLRLW